MEDILDAALDSLDMLSTVTNARKEYLAEMRLRGVRSLTTNAPSTSSARSHCTPTKENFAQMERTMLYCAAGSSKMFYRRQKLRPSPYDITKRKPLNTLVNPMTSRHGIGGSLTARSRSSDSYSERSGRIMTTDQDNHQMPLLFHNEEYHLPCRSVLNYSKTEKFPVPLLSRSKSLEDLRESPNKSRIKQVRFQLLHHCDDNSNGTASSNGSNSLESPLLSVSPRTSFFNVLKEEACIKNEIESMSMLIEKLDVA